MTIDVYVDVSYNNMKGWKLGKIVQRKYEAIPVTGRGGP
jgi:hypothetical protein